MPVVGGIQWIPIHGLRPMGVTSKVSGWLKRRHVRVNINRLTHEGGYPFGYDFRFSLTVLKNDSRAGARSYK